MPQIGREPYGQTFFKKKWGNPVHFFAYFTEKTLCLNRIRTRIARAEGERADHHLRPPVANLKKVLQS